MHTTDTTGLRVPCPSCGAQLIFSAEQQQLSCTHCGTTDPVPLLKTRLAEHPLAFRVQHHQLPQAPTEEKRLFTCTTCGAKTQINRDVPTLTCAFCGSKTVNPDAQKTRLIEPAGVLPFRIGRSGAQERFKQWVGNDWLAPSDLKAGAVLDNLHGMYVPYWTFDARAESSWSGEAGHHYYVSVPGHDRPGRDANGRAIAQRQQRTRWEHRSGHHAAFYDDLLIMASRNLSTQQAAVAEVSRYDMTHVVDYDPRFLLGWEAEVYSIDLTESARNAEAELRRREESACAGQLGGDVQRNLRVDTQLSEQTFKHLLLPLWICAYTYRGKLYRFLVNGQTGQVAGERPKSATKIALLVLGFVLLVLFFVWLGRNR